MKKEIAIIIVMLVFITSVTVNDIFMSRKREIVTVSTVMGYLYYNDGWYNMQDSSHTVKKEISFGKIFPMSVTIAFVKNTDEYLASDFLNYAPGFELVDKNKSSYASSTYDFEHYPNTVFVIIPHDADAGTKSHEISHAVDAVMNHLGLEGTECRSYMIGYLMNEIKETPVWKRAGQRYNIVFR